MRIALVAPPFIAVPPPRYGGTELFIAHLASRLTKRGHKVVVYANGESRLPCEARSLFAASEWPPKNENAGALKDFEHSIWAISDAARKADVIHVNGAAAVACSWSVPSAPMVCTLHHPHEPELSELYLRHSQVDYIAISRAQAKREQLPRMTTIHHGIDLGAYTYRAEKDAFLSFIGRIAPQKGPHLAIEVARRTGIPLKIAGEIQPAFQDYFDTFIRPHLDGRLVEYVGEADHRMKNELFGRSMAMLFPIQWEEPFGLVLIEAMACGTPVIALEGGSVPEIVENGTSGWICRDVEEMAARLRSLAIRPASCRAHVARHFSIDTMTARYEQVYRAAVERRRQRPSAHPAAPLIAAERGTKAVPLPSLRRPL